MTHQVSVTEQSSLVSTVDDPTSVDTALTNALVSTVAAISTVGVSPYLVINEGGSAFAFALGASESVGATSITLNTAAPTGWAVGSKVMLSAYTTGAEIKTVTSVAGTTVGFAATKLAHTTGAIVLDVTAGVNPLMYGCVGSSSTNDWLGIQRMFFDCSEPNANVMLDGLKKTYYVSSPVVFTANNSRNITIATKSDYAPADSISSVLMLGAIMVPFTALASTDTFTAAGHGMGSYNTTNNTHTVFCAPYGGTLPAPLVAGKIYYIDTVPNSSTFTVSETNGGSTLNLTSDGSGYVCTSIGDLNRVYWDKVRVDLSVANVSGITLGQQQPGFTRDLRVEMDVAASGTTVSGVNALDSTTINVASTTGFPTSGTIVIYAATTLVPTRITYTGTGATTFTGCSAHPAYVGGEDVNMGTFGVKLCGQISNHYNMEINPINNTTGLWITPSPGGSSTTGHNIFGMNLNGSNGGDTGILIDRGDAIQIDGLWTEKCGHAGVKMIGTCRGVNFGGWLRTMLADDPALLVTSSTTSYSIRLMRDASSNGILVSDTIRGFELRSWDGSVSGQSDNGLIFGPFRQPYGLNGPILGGRFPVSVSTTYTARYLDSIIYGTAAGGSYTITLPTAVGWKGHIFTIKHKGADANTITVDPNASETIDGAATVALLTLQSLTIMSDGAGWLTL